MLGLEDVSSQRTATVELRCRNLPRPISLPPAALGILADATAATDTDDTGGRTVGALRRIVAVLLTMAQTSEKKLYIPSHHTQ